MDFKKPERFLKVCMFIDNKVDKKLLTNKLESSFDVGTTSVLGIFFYFKVVEIDGKFIRLSVWDLRTEDQFKRTSRSYINGANGVILIYDISNAKSLDRLSKWCHLIKDNLNYAPPILLVGNKLDLEENREVSKELVEMFKKNHEISSSMEISLKTGENVEEMFLEITRMVLKEWTPDVLENQNPL